MKINRPTTLLASLAVVGASVLTACGGGSGSGSSATSVPGVTATSITIGVHTPLTGVAAPGYDEIAPAAAAYFSYVNAHGGVYGRKIHLIIKNDEYDPTLTATVVHQLVEQDHVFAIYNGLGTPTHEAVVNYLNQNKIPDLFVASGCDCWNEATTHPYTFGWQPDYTIEGKILGRYVEQHFKGKKIGLLLQDDDFGHGGLEGITQEIPKSQIVSTQFYTSGTTTLTPQITQLAHAGAQVVISFTVPIYTVIARLTGLAAGFNPQFVVSNVGADAATLKGLVTVVGKGKAPTSIIDGFITDGYLPAPSDTSDPWVALFQKIWKSSPSISKYPFDGNVEYGMSAAYTFVEALVAAGKNLTRQGIVNAVEHSHFTGPGLTPFRYSSTDHAGYSGVEMAEIVNGNDKVFGPIYTTTDTPGPITAIRSSESSAPATGVPSAG